MKAIILAGGNATRLSPMTLSVSKHLLPVYDKPMIYYPLSLVMLAGIDDVLIIVSGRDLHQYQNLLGDGSNLGMSISYSIQDNPRGLPDAFIVGEKFIGNEKVCLILGDNIFWGSNLPKRLNSAFYKNGSTIFCTSVSNPKRFGVAEFTKNGRLINIIEKPENPKSNWAITGLYVYESDVIEHAKELKPSSRGELEIADLNLVYLKNRKLHNEKLGRGFAWLDAGTPDSMLEASQFVKSIQEAQNFPIACIEEVALNNGWIDKNHLGRLIANKPDTNYYNFIRNILND